jgi:hypothetical protein
MTGVVSPIKPNERQQTRDTLRRENIKQIVSPEQVWELLTQAQQQRVMQVMVQVGRSLVQREAKESNHESH